MGSIFSLLPGMLLIQPLESQVVATLRENPFGVIYNLMTSLDGRCLSELTSASGMDRCQFPLRSHMVQTAASGTRPVPGPSPPAGPARVLLCSSVCLQGPPAHLASPAAHPPVGKEPGNIWESYRPRGREQIFKGKTSLEDVGETAPWKLVTQGTSSALTAG